MATSSAQLEGSSMADAPSSTTSAARPSPSSAFKSSESATPYGVSVEQLEALSAMAYLLASPLQRQQPCGSDATHPALLVAARLLQHGVDPERVIQLVECRYEDSASK
ncbi:unspecified product [Leptomonas pyrrhocoris]|uniref:Unspecified product n=1 Tax=Leptomonas pyrrhocoris TaxID=157538 RepID=A0A0M9FV55_LEPPY|nr:unspecified product [Leptomonas pyrrhocoris]XP_015655048.1 unspecified product [Leptomonas pyrrhocoris]KPA76608.1 unspecified product [Leptomonas pyrrhocoris]KPA76609.1 unspecified product [Leptomonas pyrrhocoris]|eukprot:XP_015655047.1 unspecified product [Leptomonas pyrrhocoris]